MAFTFSLSSVLRVREIIERREKLRLESLQQSIVRVAADLERIRQLRAEVAQERNKDLETGLPAVLLQCSLEHDQILLQDESAALAQMKTLETERTLQIARLEQAQQRRQLLTDMRDRQRADYDVHQAREQEKFLNDLFLARRRRND